MLRDPLLQERYTRHLARLVALARSEVERTRDDVELSKVVYLYMDRFRAWASGRKTLRPLEDHTVTNTRKIGSQGTHDEAIPAKSL